MAVRRRPSRVAPGQHFLRSSRLASDFVREAGVARGDLVVDIGAGTGVLTRALAATGARVTALEADPALAGQLRRAFSSTDTVRLVEVDVLRWAWPRESFSVVANLPFANSGAILRHLLEDPRSALQRAELIVQWDFAVKHTAVWPATLRSTYWRAWYDVSITGRLARTAFSPPPSVDAGVIRIARRTQPLIGFEEHEEYWRFLSDAFRAQTSIRRSLRAHLPGLELKRLAPTLGFAPEARARDLDARQWATVFRRVSARLRRYHGE
ncbi:MAG: rRNA adenine dimethyltransferase family protein [Actinomycetota bacterium]